MREMMAKYESLNPYLKYGIPAAGLDVRYNPKTKEWVYHKQAL